jgi:predicted outer membrane protein
MRFSRAITVFSSVAMCGVALQLRAADEPASNPQAERQAERQERQTERQVERQTNRQERQVERQVAQEIPWQGTDQMLATCVAIDNKAEVALAEFGASKAQNEKVKQFAKMLVTDHQKFQQKLQQFAPSSDQIRFTEEQATTSGGSKVEQAAGTSRREARIQQTAANEENRDRNQAERRVEAGIDPVQLHRELAAQCLTDAKQMLTKSENKNFDECFVGHQIAMHGAMISKLKVLERHSSEELAQVLADGQKATQAHLEKAEQLMKELAAANNSTRREGATSRD